jgi:phospholipase/lecithinase/hemolysin
MAPTGVIIATLFACLDIGALASTVRHQYRHHNKRSGYPFNELVVFGDELSDNGNGSYAHNITGGGSNNYGFGTWTDGPVAVSYLADLLDVPLNDYAFGSSNGGSTIGATIDNAYTLSGSKLLSGEAIPSVYDQIHNNYTLNGSPKNIGNALQFMWVGQADLLAQVDWFFDWDPKNTWFANNISERIVSDAEYLVESGAPYVFVANIYPKHRAPVAWTYLCGDSDCTTVLDTLGKIIVQANTAIESALKSSKHADKFIHYDVFGFMNNLMDNKDDYGLSAPLTGYCDGDPAKASWDTCTAGSYYWEGATKFVWMTFVEPTTTVHRFIAQDMKKTIDAFFGA